MAPVIVYGVAPSGNSQKAILGCQLMGVPYELRVVPNLIGKEAEVVGSAKSPEYLRLNPRGTVPVLIDPNSPAEPASKYGLDGEFHCLEGLVVNDSASILTYLALKYAPAWYNVNDPVVAGRVNSWLAFAANDIHFSLLKVRVSKKFGWDIAPFTYDQAIAASHKTLAYLNKSLAEGANAGQEWLVEGPNPSIADIAVFPYVAFAEHSSENEILLSQYPAVADWLARFKRIPNYLPLPGI